MLGLHQTHASYSPASVAAAAAALAGNSSGGNNVRVRSCASKSRAPTSGSNTTSASKSYTSTTTTDNICKELQGGGGELRTRWHHQSICLEDGQQGQQARLVHVPAQTATPLFVDSMPKCSRRSSAGRRADFKNEHATRTRAQLLSVNNDERDSSALEFYRANGDGALLDDDTRHFLLRERQRQREANSNNNQVVLIMSDTSTRAGPNGIPIIGRRLPSKSFVDFDTSKQEQQQREQMLMQSLDARHQKAPVVGRRSHRMSSSASKQMHAMLQQQQPLSIIETRSSASERAIRVLNVRERERDARASAEHLPFLATPQVDCGDARPLSARPIGRVSNKTSATTKGESKRKLSKLVVVANSCLSSQSGCGQQEQPGAGLCCDSCCQQSVALPASLVDCSSSYNMTRGTPCLMSCCNLTSNSTSGRGARANEAERISSSRSVLRSSSVSRTNTTGAGGNHSESKRVAARKRAETCDDLSSYECGAHNAEPLVCQANDHQLFACPFESRASAAAAAAGAKPVHARRSSRAVRNAPPQPPPALLMRASDCHLAHDQFGRRRKSATPPPVPSKPHCLSMANAQQDPSEVYRQRRQQQQQQRHQLLLLKQQKRRLDEEQEQESTAVTQMYESLAAELKAKLGNPNWAPILLPPKDYDTLSRNQGKLTGIELRRSTNPQLVGPTAAAAAAAAATVVLASSEAESKRSASQSSNMKGDSNKQKVSRTTSKQMSQNESQTPARQTLSPTIKIKATSQANELNCEHQQQNGQHNSAIKLTTRPDQLIARSTSISNNNNNRAQVSRARAPSSNQSDASGDGSLQRSRSNSSSGLGSISIGASSPDHNLDTISPHCSPSSSLQASGASPSSSSASSSSSYNTNFTNEPNHYEQIQTSSSRTGEAKQKVDSPTRRTIKQEQDNICESALDTRRGKGIENHNPSQVSDGILWNGRVEIPLKVNSERRNGNTYLATKQIIY